MANEQNLTPFPPGVSGNPKGRPKGSKNTSTVLREMLEVQLEFIDPITGEKVTREVKGQVAARLIQNALDGKQAAIDAIFDRTEGKPKRGDEEPDDVMTGGVLAVPNSQGVTSEEWEKQYEEHNAKINEKINEKPKSTTKVIRV